MLSVYSGNGNSTPSVLTVPTALPVDGFSPGAGSFLGVERGAASRCRASSLGGAAAAIVLRGGGFLLFGAGVIVSAGRSTASGALRAVGSGAGAATSRTLYVGGGFVL